MFPRKLSIRIIVPLLSKIIKCTTKFENNEMPSRSQKNKEKCLHMVKQAQESCLGRRMKANPELCTLHQKGLGSIF